MRHPFGVKGLNKCESQAKLLNQTIEKLELERALAK